MAKYTVKNTSILHNGKLYKEGSTIELTDIQAKRLEDFVTVLPNQTPVKPKPETKTQTSKNSSKTKTASSDNSKTENTENTDGENNGGVKDGE